LQTNINLAIAAVIQAIIDTNCAIWFPFAGSSPPELLPCGYLVGDNREIVLCLKGEPWSFRNNFATIINKSSSFFSLQIYKRYSGGSPVHTGRE
jgi:hypothetical protein